MFRRLFQQDYWHGESNIGPNITPGILGGYYCDLRDKTIVNNKMISDMGVPLAKVQGTFCLQPVTVCQVALGWYERWLDNKSSNRALEKFLLLADWLVDNSEYRNKLGGVWPMNYGIATYLLDPGWISALVQGQAISVLVRAYKITQKVEYLHLAKEAIVPFNVNIHLGGVLFEGEDGRIFFEEYPSLKEVHVLNGFISALWGLYDYYLTTKDEIVKKIYLRGMESLLISLPLFDAGYWSRYSLMEHRTISNIASPFYHKVHISQLKATNIINESKILLDFAERWERDLGNKFSYSRVILTKVLSRLSYIYNEKTKNCFKIFSVIS